MKSSHIKFGVMAKASEIEKLVKYAITAEKLGFDSIHVSDHVFHPMEALTTLTAVAMKTKKIKVATGILDMNRRNPATLAHVTATLDVISNGRLILGVGCGMGNYASYNVPKIGDTGKRKISRKVSRAKEAIEVLKKFWTEPTVNYKGQFFKFEKALIEAKPLQKPHPPIWVAAYGTRMKRIAAKLGDGFITQTLPPFMYKEEVDKTRCFAKKFGRDPNKIKTVLATLTSVGLTRNDALMAIEKEARRLLLFSIRYHHDHHLGLSERLDFGKPNLLKKQEDIPSEALCQTYLIGKPEDIISRIEEYMKGGMSYLVAMGLDTMDSLKLFSEKVISCYED